jgi:DNA-binding response OmpR family regulator
VWRSDVELDLTAREFSLLRYFMHHPGDVLSAEDLLEHVWDANADPFTSSVRVILSRLRRKLGDPAPIVTITNVGYQLRMHSVPCTDQRS